MCALLYPRLRAREPSILSSNRGLHLALGSQQTNQDGFGCNEAPGDCKPGFGSLQHGGPEYTNETSEQQTEDHCHANAPQEPALEEKYANKALLMVRLGEELSPEDHGPYAFTGVATGRVADAMVQDWMPVVQMMRLRFPVLGRDQ